MSIFTREERAAIVAIIRETANEYAAGQTLLAQSCSRLGWKLQNAYELRSNENIRDIVLDMYRTHCGARHHQNGFSDVPSAEWDYMHSAGRSAVRAGRLNMLADFIEGLK